MTTSVKSATSATTTERLARLRLQLVAGELGARVGARIRSLRQQRGLNQRELADKIGDPAVSNQHVSNWERGVYRPSDRYLGKIAAALDVDIAELMAPDRSPEDRTPDLMGALKTDDDSRLGRIEARLDEVLMMLRAAEAQRLAWEAEVRQRWAQESPGGRRRRVA
jgi:transcriptional regulator with XRE-family HTH domain